MYSDASKAVAFETIWRLAEAKALEETSENELCTSTTVAEALDDIVRNNGPVRIVDVADKAVESSTVLDITDGIVVVASDATEDRIDDVGCILEDGIADFETPSEAEITDEVVCVLLSDIADVAVTAVESSTVPDVTDCIAVVVSDATDDRIDDVVCIPEDGTADVETPSEAEITDEGACVLLSDIADVGVTTVESSTVLDVTDGIAVVVSDATVDRIDDVGCILEDGTADVEIVVETEITDEVVSVLLSDIADVSTTAVESSTVLDVTDGIAVVVSDATDDRIDDVGCILEDGTADDEIVEETEITDEVVCVLLSDIADVAVTAVESSTVPDVTDCIAVVVSDATDDRIDDVVCIPEDGTADVETPSEAEITDEGACVLLSDIADVGVTTVESSTVLDVTDGIAVVVSDATVDRIDDVGCILEDGTADVEIVVETEITDEVVSVLLSDIADVSTTAVESSTVLDVTDGIAVVVSDATDDRIDDVGCILEDGTADVEIVVETEITDEVVSVLLSDIADVAVTAVESSTVLDVADGIAVVVSDATDDRNDDVGCILEDGTADVEIVVETEITDEVVCVLLSNIADVSVTAVENSTVLDVTDGIAVVVSDATDDRIDDVGCILEDGTADVETPSEAEITDEVV